MPTIERLRKFISENDCQTAGVHEEEYRSRPDAKAGKIIIRYPVIKAQRKQRLQESIWTLRV